MARCPHYNVQQFTECCLDCGRNVYETDEEYLKYLIERKQRQDRNTVSHRIEQLEIELGIKHAGNRGKASDDQTSDIGW